MQNNTQFSVGFCAEQGKRKSMEDTIFVNTDMDSNGQYNCASVFGVFDGHGGKIVAEILRDELPEKLVKGLIKGDEKESIVRVFEEQDNLLIQKALSEGSWQAGSTAVVAMILDNILYVANVGDSEAVLITDKQDSYEEPVTTIHQPNTKNESEMHRIQDMGGKVFFGRVFGMLAISRAFGDIAYKIPKAEKNYVIATPSVFSTKLDNSCKFLILASDGLWDVWSKFDATRLVSNSLLAGMTTQEVAERLVSRTLMDEDCTDNVSVLIVVFNWGPHSVRPSITPVPKTEYSSALPELYLKSVQGVTLEMSYYYLDQSQHNFCLAMLGKRFPLPCWVSQKFISSKLFGEVGVRALALIEKHHGRFFLWATEFSSVHITFAYDEKPIVIDNVVYAGPEQYFQLQKSVGTKDQVEAFELMKTADPDGAYGIGRRFELRPDWETIKDDVMFASLQAKFSQHEELKNLLLETDDNLLVQIKPNDDYWGTGSTGLGKNRHTEILMKVRTQLVDCIC